MLHNELQYTYVATKNRCLRMIHSSKPKRSKNKSKVFHEISIRKSRVPNKKCIGLCFVYLKEFLMLIQEMSYVFQSKQT